MHANVSWYARTWPTAANITTPYQVTPEDAANNCFDLMKTIAEDYSQDKLTKLELKPKKKQALDLLKKTIAKAGYKMRKAGQATIRSFFSQPHVEMVVIGVAS
jgi:hypothetical protein